MVEYHKPKILKNLVIPSRMKDCAELELKVSTYAEKQIGRAQTVKVKDRVKEIFLNDRVLMVMRDKVHKTFKLVGRDIHCNNYKKKFIIPNREIEDGSDLNAKQTDNKIHMFLCSFKGRHP